MRFIRRTEPDHTMVSVRLSEIEGKARGEVFLPMGQRGEALTTASMPEGGALSAAEALGLATTQALEYRTDVGVIDAEGVWRPEWGTLHDRSLADELAGEVSDLPAEAAGPAKGGAPTEEGESANADPAAPQDGDGPAEQRE